MAAAVMTRMKNPQQQQQQRLLLLSDLQDHNVFFDNLVDMIPSKLYIAGNSGDDFNPKYFKGQHKENKEARRAQKKASKRAKFDPSLSETTTKAKTRLDSEQNERNHGKLLPQRGPTTSTSTKEQDGEDENTKPVSATMTTTTTANASADRNKSRIEALRAKLHAKIAEKTGNRPTDPSVVSKRAARRAEKQRRKEEAIKRKHSGAAHTKVGGSGSHNGNSNNYTLGGASSKTSSSCDPAQDLAQIDFGRITGLNPSAPHYKNNKALANAGSGKNLEKILADAEEKRQKLEALKRSQSAEDKEKLAKLQWSDALKEASGERVKDDPAKIKNKLKRKAAKKSKSQKAWKSRMDQTQQKMDERQKIRSHNLDKRKLGGKVGSNLSKKKIVEDDKATTKSAVGGTTTTSNRETKRLSRPGFEGKKQGFLNAKKHQ